MKNIMLSLFFTLQVVTLCAQKSVHGYVLSENNKGKLKALPFVNVYWQGTNYGTSTDSTGFFQLAIPETSNRLIASFVGYESDTLDVKDFDATLSLVLKESITLDAVEIEARQRSTRMNFINPIKSELITERELFKAACCNLSESFETNPSVDVNFTDAVTGTKQIEMLGLNGPYTMISRENMPGIRGLGNAFGLSFIPGSWISSIQVTKGVGSVVNGYESIAGQINTELKKPDEGKQTFLNGYVGQSGRMELNFVNTQQVNEHWATTLLLHGNTRSIEQDNNKDGFMDFPLQDQINVMNRWKYNNQKGLMGQIGFHYVNDKKEGGQSQEKIDEEKAKKASFIPYKIDIETERIELYGKMGYVFAGSKYKSMGLQASYLSHSQESSFGDIQYFPSQETVYLNYIYQSILGNTFHKFKTGASFLYDGFVENVFFRRYERVPGAFFEYTYEPSNNFTLVAGIRGDYHNIFDPFITPRLHLRWASSERSVFRLLAGSGQKTASPFAEHQSLFASSRNVFIRGNQPNLPYGLQMEKAWNFGFNWTQDFRLDYRDGYLSLDLYRTQFQQQVILDLDQGSNQAIFYNLKGESISNSAQLELGYELIKFMDLKLAYRFTEVMIDYETGTRLKPFTPRNRLFANLAYSTAKNDKGAFWSYDLTAQWVGEQRIPSTQDKSIDLRRANNSPSFMLYNAQFTRNFNDRWSAYLGVENIFDFRQNNPIIDANNPFGNQFDASMVWGPIFGRMLYAGFRFSLKEKK